MFILLISDHGLPGRAFKIKAVEEGIIVCAGTSNHDRNYRGQKYKPILNNKTNQHKNVNSVIDVLIC